MAATKIVAVGALAFNQFAFITAPILGIAMEGIETVPDGNKTKPQKPGETPRHPYGRIGFQWLVSFNRNIAWYYKLLNF